MVKNELMDAQIRHLEGTKMFSMIMELVLRDFSPCYADDVVLVKVIAGLCVMRKVLGYGSSRLTIASTMASTNWTYLGLDGMVDVGCGFGGDCWIRRRMDFGWHRLVGRDNVDGKFRRTAGTRTQQLSLLKRRRNPTVDELHKDAGQTEHYGGLIVSAVGRKAGVCGSTLHIGRSARYADTDIFAQANICRESWRQTPSR